MCDFLVFPQILTEIYQNMLFTYITDIPTYLRFFIYVLAFDLITRYQLLSYS